MNAATIEGLKKVQSGVLEEYRDKSERICVEDAMKLFKKEGFEIKEMDGQKFETNGWDYDWWVHGASRQAPELVLVIAGSGYYGGITIHKADDE